MKANSSPGKTNSKTNQIACNAKTKIPIIDQSNKKILTTSKKLKNTK